ncbi:MAG: F0F1 ATP synthase subunit gamma, partial [Candidatus Saccharimonadales bacterium]
PIVEQIKRYRSTQMYYQQYVSLMVQEARKLDLSRAVSDQGSSSETDGEDVISEATYIFEPSTHDVVAHLERTMTQIIVSQLILDSKLAQYASRFKAMRLAHDRADEIRQDTHMQYNRARRAVKDERLKEIMNGLIMASAGAAI